MKQGLFISGTDTGIGKTIVSSLWVSAFQQRGRSVGYFKPIQTGYDSDTQRVAELCAYERQAFPSPVYAFPEPMSPHRAASYHHCVIDLQVIFEYWNQLPDQFWIVEGAGGLYTPLSQQSRIRDLIIQLKLPLLIVASTRLGTLNHTLLTLEAAQRSSLSVKGIVLVGSEDPEIAEVLKPLIDPEVPILATLPWESSLGHAQIATMSAHFFSKWIDYVAFAEP